MAQQRLGNVRAPRRHELDGGELDGLVLVDPPRQCVADGVDPGTITGITSSDGLTGGGTSGSVSLGLDPSVVQSRIAGNCPAGQAIDSVAQNGAVGCQATGAGTVTSVGSGAGLTGGPITGAGTLAVDPAVVQQRVTGDCGFSGAMTGVNANGTVRPT